MTEADTTEFDSKRFIASLTQGPGIYQMLDGEGRVLYVGKARNLKNRVASYFRASGLNSKTAALVARIRHMEVTLTRTETGDLNGALDDLTTALEVAPPATPRRGDSPVVFCDWL